MFLNWKELPWYWYGFDQFWFAALMVMLVPGLLAFCFGWLAFRSRVTGVYLSIITQAMTYALLLAFFRNDMGFGGNNGLTDFKEILGFNVQAPATRAALFAASALTLALAVMLTAAIVKSKLGKLMVAVRDAESRTRFIGWRPEHVKVFGFTVSAVMAGIAGALYVPQVGIINPERIRSGQLHRGRHLDGDRRTRDHCRPGHRRGVGQLGEKLVHGGDAGLLAVRAWRTFHRGNAVPAERHRRRLGQDWIATRRRKAKAGRGRYKFSRPQPAE